MMRILRRLVTRVRYRHFDDDLRRELAEHRAMLEAEATARGASESEARYEAARQLGNTTLVREASRGVWIAPWLEELWQDVRHAARGLRASPSFTLPALAVLRLYGLSPRDPIAYLAVLVILLMAATVAIWLPARRAVRVDPAITLRTE